MQHKISVYHISLIGCLLACTGLVASAFAPSIVWMTFTLGVMYGTGIGVALLSLCLYLLLYFDEYRGTATSIMWVLRATSSMIATRLLWKLTSIYGIQGCLLITGGIVLHVVPLIMLIRHPQPCTVPFSNLAAKASKLCSSSHKIVDSGTTQERTHLSQRNDQARQCADYKEKPNSTAQVALQSFKSLPFYVLVLYSLISEYVFITFSITIVAYTVDKGWTVESGNQIVIYNAAGCLFGRVVGPFATDKIRHSRCPMAVATFLASACCFLLLPLVTTYGGVVALTIILGLAQGYILCIKTVLIADYMAVVRISFCCGVAGLTTIPVWLCGPSIIGFFRDKNGSYNLLYVVFSVLCVLIAAMLTLLACRDRARRRRYKRKFQALNDVREMALINTPVIVSSVEDDVNC
ncbi:hypothetical protein V5799_004744 [Amblyomma americanum]|uniref:Monocarboxylate transporter n=1 Tax=Amblyomma americanum TaxID=6943 RepID=A0AAQ4D584_AMBAM